VATVGGYSWWLQLVATVGGYSWWLQLHRFYFNIYILFIYYLIFIKKYSNEF
jgi:hypothetical protein